MHTSKRCTVVCFRLIIVLSCAFAVSKHDRCPCRTMTEFHRMCEVGYDIISKLPKSLACVCLCESHYDVIYHVEPPKAYSWYRTCGNKFFVDVVNSKKFHGKVGGVEEMAYNLIKGLCVNSEVALFIHNEEDLSKNFLSFCRENNIKIFKQKKIFNRFFSELTFPLLHYKKSFSLLQKMKFHNLMMLSSSITSPSIQTRLMKKHYYKMVFRNMLLVQLLNIEAAEPIFKSKKI